MFQRPGPMTKRRLTVGIVNCTTIPRQITLDTGGAAWNENSQEWVITGVGPGQLQRAWQTAAVAIAEQSAAATNGKLDSPPYSVVVYRLDAH